MIRFDRVSKCFGDHAAVVDADFTVPAGALCALVGRSGSGKSTVLRLVNRLVEADRGTISIDGAAIGTIDPVRLRRRIGYVIQSIGLFPHWSVADNVATVPRLLGWDRARVDARVTDMLDLVGLPPGQYAQRRPAQLSGGQQQRVGVARALAADPDVLLMDEPFGALDPETRRSMQDELRRIHRATGKTILLVTHDPDEALRLADHLVLLDAGRVVRAGPLAALLLAGDAAVTAFFGDAGPLGRLALTPIAPLLRPAGDAGAPDLPLAASGQDALARMLAARCTTLTVRDAQGGIAGTLHLDDLVRGGR